MEILLSPEDYIQSNYNIIEYNEGHVKNIGCNTGKYKNPYWLVNDNNEEVIYMYCEPNILCKLCWKSYQTIFDFEIKHNLQIIWNKNTSNEKIIGNNTFYMHNIIKDAYNKNLELN